MPIQQQLKLASYLAYDDVLILPAYSEVTPPETCLTTRLTPNLNLEIPVIASPMDMVCEKEMALAISKLGGLGVIHRNLSIEEQIAQVSFVLQQEGIVAAALGIGADFEPRAEALIEAGITIFCIDSAHGHTQQVLDRTVYLRKNYPDCDLIVGNVVTYEGAAALFDAGADCVKVGVGSGSICTTRIVTGVGAPQFSALLECMRAAKERDKTIIADGGIKNSGDIAKALATGAAAVMLGSLLAGSDEAPGTKIEGKKTYRGMGSIAAMKNGSAARYGLDESKPLAPQGVEAHVRYCGPLSTQMHLLMEGLRAAMAYVGAVTLPELHQNAQFIQQTTAGLYESHPHSLC